MPVMRRILTLLALVLAACATTIPLNVHQELNAVNRTIDAWHQAAADADESRYFGLMTSEAVFLGTDATERWDTASFRAFAHPYFAKGKAWTFLPHDRHVTISPAGDIAWFDEKLESASYGDCRGSGVLAKTADGWKITHYNLTIPIPNALAKTVVQMIREAK
jgi:ketosteroid isomerase-like protein